MGPRVTEVIQKVPLISIGNRRPGERYMEMRIAFVVGPVVNDTWVSRHSVVPMIAVEVASREDEPAASTTRNRGPDSEVMSLDLTKAFKTYPELGRTGTN